MRKKQSTLIKSVSIKNFKAFYGVSKVNLGEGVNLIVGDNATGKSSFLEAIIWCLGNESILFDGIDICNHSAFSELNENEKCEVRVEVSLLYRLDNLVIRRETNIKKINGRQMCSGSNWIILVNGEKAFYPDLISKAIFDYEKSKMWYWKIDEICKEKNDFSLFSYRDVKRICTKATALTKKIQSNHASEISVHLGKEQIEIYEGEMSGCLSDNENIWAQICILIAAKRVYELNRLMNTPLLIDNMRFFESKTQHEIQQELFSSYDQIVISVTHRDSEFIKEESVQNTLVVEQNVLDKSSIVNTSV